MIVNERAPGRTTRRGGKGLPISIRVHAVHMRGLAGMGETCQVPQPGVPMYYPACEGSAAAPEPAKYVAPAYVQPSTCLDANGFVIADSACVDRNLEIQAANQAARDAANRDVFVANCEKDWAANNEIYVALGLKPPPNDCAYRGYGQTPAGGYTGGSAAYVEDTPQEILDWRALAPGGGPAPATAPPPAPATYTPVTTQVIADPVITTTAAPAAAPPAAAATAAPPPAGIFIYDNPQAPISGGLPSLGPLVGSIGSGISSAVSRVAAALPPAAGAAVTKAAAAVNALGIPWWGWGGLAGGTWFLIARYGKRGRR